MSAGSQDESIGSDETGLRKHTSKRTSSSSSTPPPPRPPLVQTVEILIRNGAKVNAAERHRVTPLMFACKEKRLRLVQTLLENAADPNLQDNRGWTVI